MGRPASTRLTRSRPIATAIVRPIRSMALSDGGDVADGPTAASGEERAAEPDLGPLNGAANRTDHDDQALGDRAATGR